MFNLYCTDVYELQEENIYIDTSSLEILKYLSGPLEKKNVGTLWQMNTYYRTYVIMWNRYGNESLSHCRIIMFCDTKYRSEEWANGHLKYSGWKHEHTSSQRMYTVISRPANSQPTQCLNI